MNFAQIEPLSIHPSDMTTQFRITSEWIRSNATPAGGYKNEQLAAIGLRTPLESGWMRKAEGKLITQADRQKFESFHTGYKPSKKSKAVLDLKTTKPFTPMCDCDVLPWEDCEHTDMEAERAFNAITEDW